jgi:hypothetical protein
VDVEEPAFVRPGDGLGLEAVFLTGKDGLRGRALLAARTNERMGKQGKRVSDRIVKTKATEEGWEERKREGQER